ncbi:oligosaccharide flippase family protein [Vibrio tubiashii]|uniref:Oligosaccharide flippase family protein n=1 Tax=Vibrio tubiashii TaxID=29498 RepID=A0AAE5GSZ8_9VIBR|nr:oligosaccharide flippase family protein [Vibrio tubiashii]NOI82328.1 oligosaccharide flippase family protein [Vibrio tubiashii]
MKVDVISNYINQVVNISIRFLMIPIYVDSFGVSSYGLIGFYLSLTSIMVLLDFGMGYAANKTLAECNSDNNLIGVIPNLLFVERIYLAVAVFLGLIVFLTSGFISEEWLTIDDLSIDGSYIITLMGLLIIVSWPQSLYQSMLSGQKKFLRMNVILCFMNIATNLIMFIVLMQMKTGIESYFYVMIVTMFVQTLLLRWASWKALPRVRCEFNKLEFKRFFSFAANITIFSISSLFYFQGPILLLTTFSTTGELGVYNLSLTFPMAILTLIYPITSTAFPRLVGALPDGSDNAYKTFYYTMSIVTIMASVILVVVGLNMEFIYNFWLNGNENVVAMLAVSMYLLLSVFIHALYIIVANVLLANGHAKTLSFGYALSTMVLFVTVLVVETVDALLISKLWVICAIIVLVWSLLLLLRLNAHYSLLWGKSFVMNIAPCLVLAYVILYLDSIIKGAEYIFVSSVLLAVLFNVLSLKKVYTGLSNVK